MRKLIISTVLVGAVFIAFGQKKKKGEAVKVTSTRDSIDYKMLGSPMPELRLVTFDKAIITNASLANDANLFIMMFNPTCEHCQEETIMLEKHIDLFKKTKMALVASPNMMQLLDFFESVTKASKYPLFQVGVDSSGFINKAYGYQSLPQINIYDKDRKLIRTFNGDTPIDSLKQYIQ